MDRRPNERGYDGPGDGASSNGHGSGGSRRCRSRESLKKLLETPEAKRLRPVRLTRAQRKAIIDEACGMWKDREDWKGKSSSEIVAELRAR